MHDPRLERSALEYVQRLPRREGIADRFSRAEMVRHLVGFAESAHRKEVEEPMHVWKIVTDWLLCLFGRHDWGRWHSYQRGDEERIGNPRTWRKCMREECGVYVEGPVCK